MNPETAPEAGVLLLDKPEGATSFKMVHLVRRALGIKKVGHAGTLDPFATGLLIICIARPATKLIEQFMAGSKKYEAVMQLGVETETLDPEGAITVTRDVPELQKKEIEHCLADFTGKQLQQPPMYSALKHKGKPLYHYARQGIAVAKDPRPVEIYSIGYKKYDPVRKQLHIDVHCSRGTYIRVLAADIGEKLGCGAHLRALRRTRSGFFSVHEALDGSKLFGESAASAVHGAMLALPEVQRQLEEAENKKYV